MRIVIVALLVAVIVVVLMRRRMVNTEWNSSAVTLTIAVFALALTVPRRHSSLFVFTVGWKL